MTCKGNVYVLFSSNPVTSGRRNNPGLNGNSGCPSLPLQSEQQHLQQNGHYLHTINERLNDCYCTCPTFQK
ncbi:hypothetical protein EXU57_17400 [Segetibacter sp. 3557_3]|nr:hypothetical protein EXU57_17400 [Segetibacter sp. 3557_3]